MRSRLTASALAKAEASKRWDEETRQLAHQALERHQRLEQRKLEERQRIDEARGQPRKKGKQEAAQLGEPVKIRAAKPGGTFHAENLAPAGAPPVIRSRRQTPLTAPQHRSELVKQSSEVSSHRRPPETALDRALAANEAEVLYRFIIATLISEGRLRLQLEEHSGRQSISRPDPNNRLPFNEAERIEIGARQFVYSRLPEASRRDIDILVDQVEPSEARFYISPEEFGKITAASSDARVAKGAYIGTFKKLAHHIEQLYLEWALRQFRVKTKR